MGTKHNHSYEFSCYNNVKLTTEKQYVTITSYIDILSYESQFPSLLVLIIVKTKSCSSKKHVKLFFSGYPKFNQILVNSATQTHSRALSLFLVGQKQQTPQKRKSLWTMYICRMCVWSKTKQCFFFLELFFPTMDCLSCWTSWFLNDNSPAFAPVPQAVFTEACDSTAWSWSSLLSS